MALDPRKLLGLTLYLAFDIDADGRVLAASDESGSAQLIEIDPDGTTTALTALPGPCRGRYLPGQRAVVVSHDDSGNERHQISVLRLPRPGGPAGLPDLQPLVRDPQYVHTLAEVTSDRLCYFTNRRNGVAFDPVIRSLADGSERTLALGDRSYQGAALSPDGRWLALIVSSPVTANAEHVGLVDLTAPPGEERLIDVTPADAPAMNYTPRFAPESDALYFTSNNDREFTAVARYDLAAGTTRYVVTDDRFDLTGWLSPDGTTLLVERSDDGASELALHDVSGALVQEPEVPWPGSIRMMTEPVWAPDSGSVTLTWSGPDTPADAVLVAARRDQRAGAARLLTRSARGLSPDRAVHPELHRIPAPDGEAISCQVYRPAAGADPAGDLAGSAVLVVHGGPEAQARQDFNSYVQILAAAGHAVLVPNVRGSTGYGKRWYSADDKRRRLDSVADLAALHAFLPELGLDQSRAALWGGSYGGYMVLAGLAFQPALWAAGVDIVGVASLVTFLENTSAYRRAYREREYGTLADDRDFLHSVSPLTRVDDIIAPLFLIHGANDPRVPLSEAEQIHAALTSRGAECELLVYGDEGHGLARRANRVDAVPRALEFLARHLDRARAAAAPAQGV